MTLGIGLNLSIFQGTAPILCEYRPAHKGIGTEWEMAEVVIDDCLMRCGHAFGPQTGLCVTSRGRHCL